MRFARRLRIVCFAVAPVLVAASIVLASPSTAPAAVCSAKGAQPPQVGTGDDLIFGVDGTSTCDLWIIGNFDSGGPEQTLIYRLTPNGWKHQASPNRPGNDVLNGISAVSSTAAWAVGSSVNGSSPNHTLILHWNGKRWALQASPNVGTSFNELLAADGTSPKNAWAVGDHFVDPNYRAQILHWNGKRWKVQKTFASMGSDSFLLGVSASSAKDAWAVGRADDAPLILHWNGKRWARQVAPAVGMSSQLVSVAAVSPTSAWAVGFSDDGVRARTLILHWNGKRWRVQPSPSPAPSPNGDALAGVAATSRGAWAVGTTFVSPTDSQTLILRWTGKKWVRQPSRNLDMTSPTSNLLSAVTAFGRSTVWAVGTSGGSPIQPAAFRCC